MANEEKKKAFWETLPGILTAIGVFLGGVAAVITVLISIEVKRLKAELEVVNGELNTTKIKLKDTETEVKTARGETEKAKADTAECNSKLADAKKRGEIMIDNATGIKLVYVPGDCFGMGSSPDEEGHQDNDGPVHKVCVDGFWIGQYEVTQGQWEKIMGIDLIHPKKGDNYPVAQVSWSDVQGFITKLNDRTKKHYRLPTEAEWEYACRANTQSKYCGSDDVDDVAWYKGWYNSGIHAVGEKKANAFSLYDMSGNVWEWCADWYDNGYYAYSPQDKPQGPDKGTHRVVRGGSWSTPYWQVRAAYRNGGYTPVYSNIDFGFRLVLPVQQGQAGR